MSDTTPNIALTYEEFNEIYKSINMEFFKKSIIELTRSHIEELERLVNKEIGYYPSLELYEKSTDYRSRISSLIETMRCFERNTVHGLTEKNSIIIRDVTKCPNNYYIMSVEIYIFFYSNGDKIDETFVCYKQIFCSESEYAKLKILQA